MIALLWFVVGLTNLYAFSLHMDERPWELGTIVVLGTGIWMISASSAIVVKRYLS